MKIPLMRYAFYDEKKTRRALARFVLRAPRLSIGAQCAGFERDFALWQGRRSAVLFNSGAGANLALLQALRNLGRLRAGDAVGFSALTWSTNVMPILQMGLVPVAVDCSAATLNVMASDLRARLRTTRLKALFLTNALGFTGDLDRVRALCRREGVLLLEDNCESLGTRLPSGLAGNFGLASTFSFYVGHHMSTIEGGMACTDDPELGEMLRIVRANGWDRNLAAPAQRRWRRRHRVLDEFQAKYAFYDLGFNLRPTEVTGFLGRLQLRSLRANVLRRERNYLRLEKTLRANPDFLPLEHGHVRTLSSFCLPVLCRRPALRPKYLRRLEAAGVEVRPIIAGNIQKQPFYGKYVRRRYPLPGADLIHACGFYVGNYPELTERDLRVLERCLS
jgi:CDP-6-deoxy-D-xylo-4-hexulose-3-dehydrase